MSASNVHDDTRRGSPDTFRFTVDHMLLKLGKYLRIIGYDAVWDDCERTHELIVQANAHGRIFLTRNRKLPDQYPAADRVFQVRSADPVVQLHEVIDAFSLDPTGYLFSKCIRCNVTLQSVEDKGTIENSVHPGAFKRHDTFFTCPNCETVFYKGGHVLNTCRKLRLPKP